MSTLPKQINDAVEYILENLENNITVKDIADHCHFSEFYFNRMFKSFTGESVYAFIKRRRLEKSAFDLSTKRESSITDIALQYGYSSSNYSVAFKKHYNESPHGFKKTRSEKSTIVLDDYDYYDTKIRTEKIDTFTMIYERYIGNYKNMSFQWDDYIERHKPYRNANSVFVELSYDDPIITDEERCIYDLGMMKYSSLPENTLTQTIPGGTYKVFQFKGHVSQLLATYQGLFQVWLLQSGISLGHRKIFQLYRSVDCDTQHMTIDIYIPC